MIAGDSPTVSEFDARAAAFEKNSPWVRDARICASALDLVRGEGMAPRRILDAGGGTGFLAQLFKDEYEHATVEVLDISKEMLRYVPRGLRTKCSSIEDFRCADGMYDLVLLRQVLHYLEDPACALARIRKWLGDAGLLYIGQIATPDPDSAEWLQTIAALISRSRKRVFEIREILALLHSSGFRLAAGALYPYQDTIDALARRATESVDSAELAAVAMGELTDGVSSSLGVVQEGDSIRYTVLWFSAVFAASGAE
jgi:SAM-dependent methyltransferase